MIFRIFPSKVNRPLHLRVLSLSRHVLPHSDCVGSYHTLALSLLIQFVRELQTLIKSTSSPSSLFHQSHAAGSTDVTVHPEPNVSNSTAEPDKKKRKREAGEPNDHALSDTQHARFPNLFHTNKHLLLVNEMLKKECEQVVELTVRTAFLVSVPFPTFVSSRTKSSYG